MGFPIPEVDEQIRIIVAKLSKLIKSSRHFMSGYSSGVMALRRGFFSRSQVLIEVDGRTKRMEYGPGNKILGQSTITVRFKDPLVKNNPDIRTCLANEARRISGLRMELVIA